MAVTIGSVTEGNANAEEIKNNSPDSELYEKNKKYLQGSLVKFNDKIYLAKRNVPGDVDLDNPYYWEIFMDAADSKRVDELFEKTGNLDELETESKDNLVAAINEAVLYTAQSLTEEQKAQARANIGAGTPYTLPQATAEALGGVKADSAEAADTQPVRIGSDGKLYTTPGVTDISTKMDANNPVGKGSFSMNRKAGTVVGAKSHAEGSDTTASGSYSHAEGDRTTASGFNSHAEGGSTNAFSSVVTTTNPTTGDIITAWKTKKFSIAKGDYSHVEGKDNLALEKYSHAEGGGTTASNYYSHAEGSTTTASGFGSHAEGGSTTASKDYSHAEGVNTTASSHYSHAEGTGTTASGYSSHAEGSSTKASGSYSHAEGDSTTASGYSSHAEGLYTTASGDYSHAEGRRTKASGKYSHAQGKFNIEDTSNIYADIIGNGTSDTARSNAATVDWSGNAWFAGDVYTGSTSGTNKDDGSKKLATEEYVNNSIAAGGDNTYYLVKITASSWNLDNATFTIEQTHNEIYEAYQSGKTIIADLYAEENLGDIKQDVYQGRLSTIHVKVRGYIDEIQFIGFVKESRIAYIWAYFDGSQQMYCNGKFIHYVEKDDIVTSISSSSKDSEVPSAKCVYDELQKTDTKSLGLTSAAVGQTIKVKAIDASGKPTAWEAADMPSGGGWELITDITLTEDGGGGAIANVTRNDKGEEFEYRQCMVCLSGKVIDGWPKGAYISIKLYENNDATGINAAVSLTRLAAGEGGTEYKTTVEISIFGNLMRLIACGGSSDTSSLIIRNDTSIDTFRSINLSGFGNNQWVAVPLAAGGRIVIYGRK